MGFSPPKSGDIVDCRFPEAKVPRPGPKERPALVLEVEAFEDGSCDVVVAYGTSQGVDRRHAGELTIQASTRGCGLARNTKFNLREAVKLPFTSEWFGVAAGKPFGDHPKRGALDLNNLETKRQLQSAVGEAKEAGAFEVLDLVRQAKTERSEPEPSKKPRARR